MAVPADDGEVRSISAEERIFRFILEACPPPPEPLRALFQEIGTGVLPAVAGTERPDLRLPAGLYATRLGGREGILSWHSRRFPLGGPSVEFAELTGSGLPPEVVGFDGTRGEIRVDAAAFPADGRWRLFALSEGELIASVREGREILALQRPETRGPDDGPAELVHQGRVAEGWANAIAAGWEDTALAGLLLLAFPRMGRLLTEARREIELSAPTFSFVLEDLEDVRDRELAALQLGLIETFC